MYYLKSLLSLFVIGLLLANPIFAGNESKSGTIKGILVDDETKVSLAGANVEILDQGRGAATDAEGYYVINNVPVGSYALRFSYLGYETVTRTDVIVRSNRITFVNDALKLSVMETDAIVVSAGYFAKTEEEPTSNVNFTAEEIRRAPGSAGDVSRIIYGLPGVAKVNDTKNSLIVRGGSSLENGFYVDNIEINNINHFPEQGASGGPIGMLNVDFIEDVNFYSGGFSSVYGDRLSSIMDLKMREGNRDELDAQLDLNFSGFGGSIEGPLSGGKGSWMMSARRSFLDFIVGAIGEDATSVPQYGDIHAKLVYDLSQTNQLTILNIGGLDAIGVNKDDAVENQDNMYNDFQILQNTAGLNWRYLWSKKGYSNTALSYAYTDYDFTLSDTRHYMDTGSELIIMKQNSAEQEYRLRNVNHYRFNQANNMDFGLEGKIVRINYNNYYGPYNDFLGNPTPVFTVKDDQSAAKLHGFINYSWQPLSRLTVNPGIRISHFTYNSSTNLSPRFSASYQLTEKTAINFSTGIYYQNLPLILLSQDEAYKDMNDPQSYHFILGLSHLLTDNTRLTLEAYDKEYYNFPMDPAQPELFVIDEINYTSIFIPHENLVDNGRARARGVELMIQKKLAKDFYGMICGSYSKSEYRDLNNHWRNRIVDNRFTFNVEGGYKPNNKWEFSMRWIYAGGVPYTPYDVEASEAAHRGVLDENRINFSRLPDYHSLNVRFDKRFFFQNTNIVFYLSVWNIYGRKNIGVYSWNEIENKQEANEQWSALPIFGIELEL
ncbi:MAG: TonB-dependent receptor [Calditrichaceae bacterium]